VAGLAIFTLGSIFCGAAGSLPQLIVARAFQGLALPHTFLAGFQ
jgi:MFS family permease